MFKYVGECQKVKDAIVAANSSDLYHYLIKAIREQKHYDMSTVDGLYLSANFAKFNRSHTAKVVIYYPRWRFSKAYGYFSRSKPDTIHINGYKLKSMSTIRLVSLFQHEKAHMQDFYDKEETYNHGDNSPVGKELTYQYSINRFVYDFYGYKPSRKLPWYKRIIRFFF